MVCALNLLDVEQMLLDLTVPERALRLFEILRCDQHRCVEKLYKLLFVKVVRQAPRTEA